MFGTAVFAPADRVNFRSLSAGCLAVWRFARKVLVSTAVDFLPTAQREIPQAGSTRSSYASWDFELESRRNNQYLRVAGLVILRQRPSTAKGITFVTIEDETGTANLVVKQNIWERYYKIARRSPAWIAYGKLEKKSGVIHVVVGRLEDLSQRLNQLHIKSRDFR